MKKYIICLFIFIMNVLHCQSVTCIYELKFRQNQNKDSLITSQFYLDINGKKSIFRSELQKKSDSLVQKTGLGLGRGMLFFTDLFAKKDLETKEIQKVIITPTMRTRFFIPVEDRLEWKVINEKQKIGDLYCQKAELDYGGRHWIAWFTDSINLQDGPYIFNGLPGLIVKISDSRLDYDFSLVQLKHVKHSDFFVSPSGKKINWPDFQKIMQSYYDDPFYEVKSSGVKYAVGDDKGNVSTLSPKTILKKFQVNMRNNGNNLIEINKALHFK
ncbi:GLPGLI family protein [Chryseobacterium arthrosphaerae]|uniref:GLPGLI family protein n=1 Tax=Chryseobacterium arthrosphaerae TaxID=651561 RepID=UPI0023E0D22D|nr:GLPGLI family protein [Chryseobacterium arthrosphaerae]WES96731.1 GLPGLI family protein [Chryseobacterium arthrosphaerae]